MGFMVSAMGELEKTVLPMFTITRNVVMMRATRPVPIDDPLVRYPL